MIDWLVRLISFEKGFIPSVLFPSLYGLMIWCPEYLKFLRAIEYEAHTQHFYGEEHNGETFSGSWENRQYKDSTFSNCK